MRTLYYPVRLGLLLLLIANPSLAQTLGEAVYKTFGQRRTDIIATWGKDYYKDVDNTGRPFIGYLRTFDQQGKAVDGAAVFHFDNDKLIQYTTIIDQENYAFWVNEFEKKLIRRDEKFWVEPRYGLVWNLKINDKKVYITAITIDAIRAIYPESFGQDWTKAYEAEFMKNCVYGNPNNLGNEKTIMPLCTCVLETVKKYFPSAKSLAILSINDLAKLSRSCLER